MLDLELIKTHLNVDKDYTEEDDYIMHLESVAVELVQRHIDRTLDDIIKEEGAIPQPLLHTMLLIIGNFYANRESIAYSPVYELPSTLKYILSMYRDYKDSKI